MLIFTDEKRLYITNQKHFYLCIFLAKEIRDGE